MDPYNNILAERYRAKVKVGNYRFSSVGHNSSYMLGPDGNYRDIEYTTVNSVQVDFHPADLNRLIDTLEYIHGANSYNDGELTIIRPSTVHDKFVQHVYQKEFKEQELREKHPLLQDLWNQYKTTLNLLASGNNIESNE